MIIYSFKCGLCYCKWDNESVAEKLVVPIACPKCGKSKIEKVGFQVAYKG